MKRFLLIVSSLLCFFVSLQANLTDIAVLNQSGELKTFQGYDALKQAYEAANEGDIITLSSGVFDLPGNWGKGITIRGVGMMPGENPTIIQPYTMQLSNYTPTITFEGILFDKEISIYGSAAANLNFYKCWILGLSDVTTSSASINFMHCYLNKGFLNQSNNIKLINCYVNDITGGSSSTYENCVIDGQYGRGIYSNCIITTDQNYSALESYYTFTNCVSNKDIFSLSTALSTNNKYLPEVTDFFKEGSQTYELKDEYATTLLGNDGTQVGMHGGSAPFSKYPTGLRITKFEAAKETSSDGKLPVEISVELK